MELKEGIIIADNEQKKRILSTTEGMKDYTFLSFEGVLEGLYGKAKKPAVFALMKEYGLSFDLAEEYLRYIPYVEDRTYGNLKLDSLVSAKSFLRKNGYYQEDKYFTYSLRNKPITIMESRPTRQFENVVERLRQYTTVDVMENKGEAYSPKVYSYKSLEDEVYGICNAIRKLHEDGVPYSKMSVLNASSDYEYLFHRMTESYGIPFAGETKGSILHTDFARILLSLCKDKESFQEVLDSLPDSPFKAELLEILVEYQLREEVPYDYIPFLKRKMKSFTLPVDTYSEMVSMGQYRTFGEDEYVFLCGLNLGTAPKIYKDEAYMRNTELELLGLPTSMEKNKEEREALIQVLTRTKNIFVSYARGKGTKDLEPSACIEQLGLSVLEMEPEYGYSKAEDQLRFAASISIYDKIHEKNPALDIYSIKDIQYKKYSNAYTGIRPENMQERFTVEKPLSFAYSNIKTYFECPFQYYANRILGLDTFESSTATRLGTFSHAVLEDSYEKDFDFEESVNRNRLEILEELAPEEYLKDEFYFEQMKGVLSGILEFNQKHEANTVFDTVEREAHIEYTEGNLKFHGYIDKLMYTEIAGEIYAAIMDYKTGKDFITLNNVWDGFHLQLPSYMYLLSKYPKFAGKKIHIIGIYLQKVNMVMLDNTQDLVKQREKSFALQGYTIKDLSLVPYIDPDYSQSTYIAGMKTVKSGDFASYSKVVTEAEEEELISIVDEKIHTAYQGVMKGEFPIAPKKIKGHDQSCTFCKYKDICFKQPKDYVELAEKKFPKEEE